MDRIDIAIVTTCMGRLGHLKQSLPQFIDQDFEHFRIYVVDWSSPDGLKDWLEDEKPARTQWISVPGRKFFNLSAARNAGGRAACRDGAGILAFIDADILLPRRFLRENWVRCRQAQRIHGDGFFLQTRELMEDGGNDAAIWGSCIVPAATWEPVQYNEQISTYSMEDNELYSLWVEHGVAHIGMYVDGVHGIQHSDEERMRYYPDDPDDIPKLRQKNKSFFRGVRTDIF